MKAKLNGEAIAQRLRALRGDETRENVANALGITMQAVAQYENGNRIPNDVIKMAYANLYGKTVDEIFFTIE